MKQKTVFQVSSFMIQDIFRFSSKKFFYILTLDQARSSWTGRWTAGDTQRKF